MNRKAYKDRLREIQMSEHDAAMYEQFSSQVTKMDVKHAFYLINITQKMSNQYMNILLTLL